MLSVNKTFKEQARLVARQYGVYTGFFAVLLIIAVAIDLLVGPYDDLAIKYLMQGKLAEALNVGVQAAFVGTAILAAVLRFRRKGLQRNNVWIALGLWNLWLLFAVYLDIPGNVFGTGGFLGTESYLVAINEQILYYGSGSTWATFWQWFILRGIVPVCAAYCLSVWSAYRRAARS